MGRTFKRRAGDILAYFDHPTPATAPPKPSTDASNTSAASPKDSSTTETTAYACLLHSGDSNTSYTLKCEEPLYWKDRPVVAGVRGVDEVLIRYRGDREKIASLIVLPLSKPQLKKMVGYYCDDPQARARLGQPDSVRDVRRVLGWTV